MLLFLAVLAGGVAITVPFLADYGLLGAMAALYVACLVAVAVAVLPMGRAAQPALALRPTSWKPVVFGSLGTIALSVAVSQIGPELEGMKVVSELVSTPGSLLGTVFVLAAMAPLAEELIFRGLLYGWIESRWGWRPALVVSAFAFAIAHFDPTYMLLVLPLGFLFSWLRWKTNSLLPSFVAHVVNNGFAVMMVVAAGSP